jgi:2-polyprenyl-6-methoxyphenol hydroxylase-like FAD-dependent oxidoreductase
MNTGIQDAIALGHALSTGTPEALADYERTRRRLTRTLAELDYR